MSIFIMIILLSLLILVHEAGHFFAARAFGIKVDKFGFGLPVGPTLFKTKVGDLEIEEYYTKKGVTIIEWADMIPDYLPEKRLDIKIKNSMEDENKRIIVITPHGRKYEELCEAVL